MTVGNHEGFVLPVFGIKCFEKFSLKTEVRGWSKHMEITQCSCDFFYFYLVMAFCRSHFPIMYILNIILDLISGDFVHSVWFHVAFDTMFKKAQNKAV